MDATDDQADQLQWLWFQAFLAFKMAKFCDLKC